MADSQAQYQSLIDLVVDDKPAPMVFNKLDGGGVISNGSKSFPGEMAPQKANGGQLEREDATLEGEFVPSRDHEWIEWAKTRCGKGAASYVENGTDADGNVWGKVSDGTGKLSEVYAGNYDSSSSDPKPFKVVCELDGIPG